MWKNLGNGAPGEFLKVQRHHLIPNEVVYSGKFRLLFQAVGSIGFCANDFRTNGMLLPPCEATAIVMGMPLHRGPHPAYTALIEERVAAIDRRFRPTKAGAIDALLRFRILQRGSQKALKARRVTHLNRRDPFAAGVSFAHIDDQITQIDDLVA